MEENYIYKEENYKIIGICMEIHRILGGGLLEIVYKDALEYEFKVAKIPYQREKEYQIIYKNIILPHKFYADFVVFNNIILEVKSTKGIANEHVAQTINYVRLTDGTIGIIANFGGSSLEHKRIKI